MMLEVVGVSVNYGQHLALSNIGIKVGTGEIVVMLGANGAGKSSLLKAIARLVPVQPGAAIRLGGTDIVDLPPHRVVEASIALVPEGRGVFGELTVRENLLLGAHARRARAGEKQR